MQGGARLVTLLAAAMIAAPVLAAPLTDAGAAQATTVDADGAVAWTLMTQWQSTGTFVDFPDHVVFPEDSWHAIDALADAGALNRVDAAAAARAASRVQHPSGGFLSMSGDPLGPWASSTRYAIALTRDFDVAIDEVAAANFLLSLQNPDGGFAPRKKWGGSGNLGSTVEATHHAVAGLVMLDALPATTRDAALQYVRDRQNLDGGWLPAGQVGQGYSFVSATYHAVHVLALLGELDLVSAARATGYVLGMQNATGGFRNYLNPEPCFTYCNDFEEITTYATAHAILTLETAGTLPVLVATTGLLHAQWLAERQLTDGPFAGAFESYADYVPPVIRFPITTSLGMNALRALGLEAFADEDAAVDFLAASQLRGTGGFGWWAGFISSYEDTEAALRALDVLGRLDAAYPDTLAATVSANQRADGSLVEPHWKWDPRLDHTALAVLSLARVDRLDAIDKAAAAAWIADQQVAGSGFRDPQKSFANPTDTWLALAALAALGELHRADAAGVASFLGDLQKDDGRITNVGWWDFVGVFETRDALRALAIIDRLDAVDADAASTYLAGRQKADGTYKDLLEAHAAVTGLTVTGRLDLIDLNATRDYVLTFQTPRGGFANEAFTVISAMIRHAAGVETAATLGAL